MVISSVGLPQGVKVKQTDPNYINLMYGGGSLSSCMRKLEESGADIVGINCSYGPSTIIEKIKEAKSICKVMKRL